MSEEIYRALAQRLDTFPSGFPTTESGVELKVLKRLFTQEEAALASVMRLTPEPATTIAARAGLDPTRVPELLDSMARKELIRAQQEGGQRTFRLAPRTSTIPGLYLILQDEELVKLFEQYYQETRGISLEHPPATRRVIPVQEAIPSELEVHPYEQAVALLENAKSWGVRDCICRLWQRSIGKDCGHPLNVCMPFSSEEGAFDDSTIDRAIDKEEAVRILHQAEEAGLVHTIVNWGDRPSGICNCCTCSCGILRGVAEFDIPTAVARSGFYAAVEVDLCDGCSDCTARCPFRALSLPEGVAVVDRLRCMGCGLCTTVCPTGALHLEQRPAGENPAVPSDLDAWLAQFAENRGMSLAAAP